MRAMRDATDQQIAGFIALAVLFISLLDYPDCRGVLGYGV